MHRTLVLSISVLLSVCVVAASPAADVISPPAQPTTGPGGGTYMHGRVITHVYGVDAQQYWIFEPADPTPASAPVIIFCHGWSAMTPNVYGAWITHLVRRGNIVICPKYQQSVFTPMTDFIPMPSHL